MASLDNILLAFKQHATKIFWQEEGLCRTFAETRQDLEKVRHFCQVQGVVGGFWASYGLRQYDDFLLVLAAMLDGWVFAPLPSRYHISQLTSWLAQVPFSGMISQGADLNICDSLQQKTIAWAGVDAPNIYREPLAKGNEKPALLIYSSGSTGQPKAIVHSPKSLVSSCLATLDFYHLEAGRSWLLSLDIAHIGGFQIPLRCLLGGMRCVAGYAPHEIERAISKFRVDVLSLVPTQLQRLMDREDVTVTLKQAHAILLGGAATHTKVLDRARSLGLNISVTYGSTEAASQVSAHQPGEYPQRLGDVGQVLRQWQVSIVHGTLRLKGPSLCLGWWQGGQFYPLSLESGFYQSQDEAEIRDDHLVVKGRSDEVFQVGGENLSPLELSGPLLTLGLPGDWIILPISHPDYGQVPVIIYRGLEPPPPRERIEAILGQSLPKLKFPRACYWHKSEDVTKPSRKFYEIALTSGQMELLWTRKK